MNPRKRISGQIGYATMSVNQLQRLADTAKDDTTRVYALEQLARWTERLQALKKDLGQG